MANMSIVQARTNENLKNSATEILEKLGLNLSTYINMSLTQLVLQRKIPFEVSLPAGTYSAEEAAREVEATLKMEGMAITNDEREMLRAYERGEVSGDELRKKILSEVM